MIDFKPAENSQLTTRRRSHNIPIGLIIIVVGVFACVCSLSFFQGNPPKKEFIVNLSYNEMNKTQTIYSHRNMTICTDQFDAQLNAYMDICKYYRTTQDIIVTRNSTNTLSVSIIYHEIEELMVDSKNPTDDQTVKEMQNDTKNSFEATEDEKYLAFKATVSTKGELLCLESANGNKTDTLVHLTERLIDQTFPELDPKIYQSLHDRGQNMRFLSAKEVEEVVIQETYLGEVGVEYTYDIDKSGKEILSKEYTDEDIKTYKFNLGGELPDIQYQSETVISNCAVEKSNEQMVFNITDFSTNSEEDKSKEIVGLISVRINSTLEVKKSPNRLEDLLDIIKRFEEAGAFEIVDLSADNGSIKVNLPKDPEQEIINPTARLLNSHDTPVYTKNVTVFQIKVFLQKIELKLTQDNYQDYSNVYSDIYLNNQKKFTAFNQQIQHPWRKCKKLEIGHEINKTIQIFEILFPILGIVQIPVRASIDIKFGLQFKMSRFKNDDEDDGEDEDEDDGEDDNQDLKEDDTKYDLCNLMLKAYVKPGIAAEGGVTIAKVIEGGVSFSGYVANTSFNFNFYINRRSKTAELDIFAEIIPFEYSIDIYYKLFKCDFKKLFNRNLFFKHIVKGINQAVKAVTKMVEICGFTQHSLNIASGSVGKTYTLPIFKSNFNYDSTNKLT